jgi:hypothetical protein
MSPATRRSLFLILAVASPAWAEVYKWVDEKGQTHYGSAPPTQGEYSTMKPLPEPSSDSSSAPLQTYDKTPAGSSSDADILERERKRSQQASLEAKQREQRCAQAKARLQSLKEAGVIYSRGADGERKFYNNEERAAMTAQAERDARGCN